jgi:hypothetical protein
MPWVCRNVPARFKVHAPQAVIDFKSKNDTGSPVSGIACPCARSC